MNPIAYTLAADGAKWTINKPELYQAWVGLDSTDRWSSLVDVAGNKPGQFELRVSVGDAGTFGILQVLHWYKGFDDMRRETYKVSCVSRSSDGP